MQVNAVPRSDGFCALCQRHEGCQESNSHAGGHNAINPDAQVAFLKNAFITRGLPADKKSATFPNVGHSVGSQ